MSQKLQVIKMASGKDDNFVSFEYTAGNPSIRTLEGILHCWPTPEACRNNPNPDISHLPTKHTHATSSGKGKSQKAKHKHKEGSQLVPRKNSNLSIASNNSANDFPSRCSSPSQPSFLVLASQVPHTMKPSDFATFLLEGDDVANSIIHAMVLRGSKKESYMILLAVSDVNEACMLVEAFDKKRYNQLDVEVCRVYVVIPATACDLCKKPVSLSEPGVMARVASLKDPSSANMHCTVCLEPIDSSSNMHKAAASSSKETEIGGGFCLTILCGHSFHWRCLTKWCDDSCPICRFQQHPFVASTCGECGSDHNLRICLVCGFIGCSNLAENVDGNGNAIVGASSREGDSRVSHSQEHYDETKHAYALEVTTQRVYDYGGGGYVHQLLQNAGDDKGDSNEGSPLTLAQGMAGLGLRQEVHGQKKLESAVAEFNHLLSFHLSEQRKFYEERYEQERSDAEAITASLRLEREQQVRALRNLEKQVSELHGEIEKFGQKQYTGLREEKKLTKQHETLEKLNKKISNQQQLIIDQDVLRLSKAEERRKIAVSECADLKQQINDMRTHLRMQAQAQRSGVKELSSSVPFCALSESEGGHVVVTEGSSNKGSSAGRSRRGKRK